MGAEFFRLIIFSHMCDLYVSCAKGVLGLAGPLGDTRDISFLGLAGKDYVVPLKVVFLLFRSQNVPLVLTFSDKTGLQRTQKEGTGVKVCLYVYVDKLEAIPLCVVALASGPTTPTRGKSRFKRN